MAAGYVPTSPLNTLYTNTTAGTPADPTAVDGAVQAIVQTVNDNYDSAQALNNGLSSHKNATTLDHPDQSVTTAKIKDANVTSAKLASSSVTTAKVADANITTAKLQDAAVTAAKLADDSVTAAKIADSAVGTDKIAPGAVTNDRIANGAVGASKIDPALLESYGTIAINAKFDEIDAELADIAYSVKDKSTAQIQQSIDENHEKGTIYFPNITTNIYTITDTLKIPSNTHILFAEGVTIKLDDGINKPIFQNADTVNGNNNIRIEGGIFDSNQANQTTNFSTIQLTKVTNSKFRNVEVNGNFTVGYIGVGAWDLYQCEKVLIESCKVYNSSDEGLYLRECNNCQVSGGEYYDNLFGSGVATDKGEYNQVSHVFCHGNGGSNFSINGIYSNVTNCISESCLDFNGITLGHSGSPASYSVVSGCLVNGNPNGIRVQGASAGVVVSNNVVVNNNETSGIGIGVSDSSFDCIIEANHCYNNYFGIYISTDVKGNVVKGNFVKLSKVTGITINASNNNVVEGNICENNATLGTGYGIFISSTSKDNIISNNRCFDSQSTKTQQRGIYSDGTKNIISNNILIGNSVIQLTAASGNFLSNNIMSSTDAMRFDVNLNDTTSTTITNANINADSKISFVPKTATAYDRKIYQSAIANGSVTLTHLTGTGDVISMSIN